MTGSPHIIDALHDLDTQLDASPGPLADFAEEPEVPARRQPGTLVEVLVEGEDAYTVRVANRELIAYEKAAAKHREWPAPHPDRPEQGRHFQMTFCTFVAAKREGRFTGTFDRWQEVLEDWNVIKDAPADPTR